MKNRFRLTFTDGKVIDVEHTDPEKAVNKAKKFYNREDEPHMDVTHTLNGKTWMTFAELDAWEVDMRKLRAAHALNSN